MDAWVSLALYPCGGARRQASNRFAPVLPVATNASFLVEHPVIRP